MKCLEASQLISAAQERELTFMEKMRLRCHLLICFQCRNFQKNCQQLGSIMKNFGKEKDD